MALASSAEGGGGAPFAASAAARASSSACDASGRAQEPTCHVPARLSANWNETSVGACAYEIHLGVITMWICTHLQPVCGERVHVDRVEPAREALVEGAEGVAEAAEVVHVCVEGLCLVDELGHDGLDEAEAVRGIRVEGGAGEGEEGALGDAAEGRAMHQIGATKDRPWEMMSTMSVTAQKGPLKTRQKYPRRRVTRRGRAFLSMTL